MEDLKAYLIDEAYEVLEAIDSDRRDHLCEELGDLLFQVLFLARLAEEEGAFDIDEVMARIEEKMVRRHPHVFGKVRVSDVQEVKDQWERIKAQEGKAPRSSMLSGIPSTLPALYRAFRLGLRAARVGFDWESLQAVMGQVREEWEELNRALENKDIPRVEEELGDLLFALANLARHLRREPEGLLRRANAKFEHRFMQMEALARSRGLRLPDLHPEELESLWKEVKERENSLPRIP
jgi:MazG family protein